MSKVAICPYLGRHFLPKVLSDLPKKGSLHTGIVPFKEGYPGGDHLVPKFYPKLTPNDVICTLKGKIQTAWQEADLQ